MRLAAVGELLTRAIAPENMKTDHMHIHSSSFRRIGVGMAMTIAAIAIFGCQSTPQADVDAARDAGLMRPWSPSADNRC